MTCIVLLTGLWCNSGHFVWNIARQAVYNTRSVTSSDTIILYAPNRTDITWIREDEIVYKGHMFDIRQQFNDGSRLLLIGSFDKADDNLFSLLSDFFDTDDNDDKQHRTVKYWSFEAVLVYRGSPTGFLYSLPCNYYLHKTPGYISPSPELQSPPPRPSVHVA